ncbi:MAG: hypothetical protein J6S63_05485 [Atopobiaceae bacterium]|nr:hypothetical protein [Atopobiaceae bacterium]
MGDCLRRAYDEAERAMSRGDSDATRTRHDVADEVEEAVKAACDRILPAHYMTDEAYQHLRQRVADLRTENAKLWELVTLAHRYIAESCAVQYPYAPEPVSYLRQLEVERRMRELGREASE